METCTSLGLTCRVGGCPVEGKDHKPYLEGDDDIISHCCGLVVSDNGCHSMVWGLSPSDNSTL